MISTVEKVSAVHRSIAATIPLPIGVRTTRALLFSPTSRLVSRSGPFSVLSPAHGTTVSPGPMEDSQDATGPLIASWCAVPDRASAGPDRRDCCRQPAGCRRLRRIASPKSLIPGHESGRLAATAVVLMGAPSERLWRGFNHIV